MYLYVTKMTETLEEVELLLNRSSRQLKSQNVYTIDFKGSTYAPIR